ncbi:phosphoribosylglycinamide formyltransferase [Planctomyces sp. SH-PL62]|uniref:phosphoribosylglycinamide formyltransferase n=1 Tax=Planctomyces sp. SH-PL62 TaxID=1636152 RepID=UPI00078C4BF6|nr:phosphoribosylglycinamide formyltransferase [Planctomyces sp. SH-PL62]AMV36418.1 Phosphoribosylglycinamide formyltransferase [Planctomyces sp. SH-PL62]
MTSTPSGPPRRPISPIRLGVCVSGGGTTLQNLLDRIEAGTLDARVVQVVASRGGIAAIARAEKVGLPVAVADSARQRTDLEAFSASVFDPIRESGADLVLLAGFLALVKIPDDFKGRVVNIHPGLIPSFCGKGYYGDRVHQAALDYGVKISGCTVHFASDEYDEGPIILQKTVPVLEGDDARALAARVFEAEREALPEAVALYASGRLRIEGRRVRIVSPGDEPDV